MDLKQLKVASLLTSERVSLSKLFINGSWKYLVDPAAPMIYDLEYLLKTNVEIVASASYGEILPNGTHTGMGGLVMNGEADLSGDAAIFVPRFVQAFSYLHPTHAERFYMYFKQPNPSDEYGMLLKPFSWQVWVSIAMMWIAIISSVQFFRFLKKAKQFQHGDDNSDKDQGYSVGDTLLWAMASICSRSYTFTRPDGPGMSILILSGIQFGMIILSIYSAFIESSLTIKTEPIKSFQDLFSHDYIITGRTEIPFGALKKDRKEALRLERISRRNYKSPEDSVLKIMSSADSTPRIAHFEVYGLFHSVARELKYSDEEMCRVSQLKTASRYPMAMFVRKHSNLKETLNQKILLIGQTGLKFRYLKHAANMVIPRCDPIKHGPDPLSISNIRVVIWLTIIGYVVSLILLIIESIANKAYSLKSRPEHHYSIQHD